MRPSRFSRRVPLIRPGGGETTEDAMMPEASETTDVETERDTHYRAEVFLVKLAPDA